MIGGLDDGDDDDDDDDDGRGRRGWCGVTSLTQHKHGCEKKFHICSVNLLL